MWTQLVTILSDPNTQWVLSGTILLGIASGVLGSFALLRKQSLIGDAMAHAALPGICLAFLLTSSKSIAWLLLGALLTSLIGSYCIQIIVRFSRIKQDTALGLVLSVFFGIGIVLLTYIAQSGAGNQSGLNTFIFGQAASLVGQDVRIISGVALVLLFITSLLFKEFKLITFDPEFAQGLGLPVRFLSGLLMLLIVAAVVVGLQAVGVVLMAAMLITPAISARYWTDNLAKMIVIAGGIGALSSVSGVILSTLAKGLATGPLIIVCATVIFLFSLFLAPQRGLVSKLIRHYRVKQSIAKSRGQLAAGWEEHKGVEL